MDAVQARNEALGLLRERTLSLPFPSFVYAEPTNACPLACVMCPRDQSPRPVGFMDFALFKSLADACAEEGPPDLLILHKDGEPLLHPRLPEMIAYAKERKAAGRVSFSTSATGLTRDLAGELVKSGLDWIDIAIDGATEATYASTRVRGDFHQVEENVRTLHAVRERMGSATPHINLRIVRMEPVIQETEAFRTRWAPLADSVEPREFKTWAGRYPESLRHPQDRRPAARTPCFSPFTALAVNWDGDVSICSVDWAKRGIVGNANRESLAEIWRGKALEEARQAHREGRFGEAPPCGTCRDWQPFDGFWDKPL